LGINGNIVDVYVVVKYKMKITFGLKKCALFAIKNVHMIGMAVDAEFVEKYVMKDTF